MYSVALFLLYVVLFKGVLNMDCVTQLVYDKFNQIIDKIHSFLACKKCRNRIICALSTIHAQSYITDNVTNIVVITVLLLFGPGSRKIVVVYEINKYSHEPLRLNSIYQIATVDKLGNFFPPLITTSASANSCENYAHQPDKDTLHN